MKIVDFELKMADYFASPGTRWAKEHAKELRGKADKGNLDASVADAAEQIAATDAADEKGKSS